MRLLLFMVIALPLFSKSQPYTDFKWGSDPVEFKSVKMKVTKDDKTVIFDGFKDGFISISQPLSVSPCLVTANIKLGGYFQMNNAEASIFKYESTKEYNNISYSFAEGDKIASLVITFAAFTYEISSVILVVSEDYKNAKKNKLIFRLSGFE